MPHKAPRPSRQQHSRVTTTGGGGGGGGGTNKQAASHGPSCAAVPAEVARHHEHAAGPGQCCSAVVQSIAAPVAAVWSLVRRFDRPQAYKLFIRSCRLVDVEVDGEGGGGHGATVAVGSVREVRVATGLPATSSRERLEILDDERRVISFRVVGGEHRLANYRSVTTVHEADHGAGAVVVESYVVDVPPGNTAHETRVFVETIVRANLQSLARTAESLALVLA